MKKYYFIRLLILLLVTLSGFAQVQKSQTLQVGNTSTSALNTSAALQIDDTSRGILLPRMSTSQRDLISNPANGLMIFNTTTNTTDTNTGTSITPIWTSNKAFISPVTIALDNEFDGTIESTFPALRVAYNGDGTPKTDADTQFVFETNALRIGTLQNLAGTPVFRGNYASLAPRALYIGSETGRADVGLQTYSDVATTASQITGIKYRGSQMAPQGLLANDRLLRITASGQWGATLGNTHFGVAAIDFNADANFSSTTRSTNITFSTTEATTLTERMRISAAGNVGIGTTAPQSSAALDISSTTRGFLPPRMTKLQYAAIQSPVDGLVVYCIDCNPKGLRVFNGTSWLDMMGNSVPAIDSTPAIYTTPSSVTPSTTNVHFESDIVFTGATSTAYQWYKNGTPISGATQWNYTSPTVTLGDIFYCQVTGINNVGNTTVNTPSITILANAPTNSTLPVVTITIDNIATTTNGTWNNAGSSYTYEWFANGSSIPNATASTFDASAFEYWGTSLTCAVRNYNSAGNSFVISNSVTPASPTGSYNGSLEVALSLRRITNNYAGAAIKVRRSSDNTTLDIGFTTQGVLDVDELLFFVGNGSGFVDTWYDQGPSANHFIQTTAANQPLIVSNGIVNTENGKPSISFATNKMMRCTSTFATREFGFVLKADGGSSPAILVAAPTSIRLVGNTNNIQVQNFPSIAASYVNNTNSTSPFTQVVHNRTGLFTTHFSTSAALSTTSYELGRTATGFGFNGNMSEVILTNAALTQAQKDNNKANQFAYYSIVP